ncbi:B3 domain-containing transcription factor VRN1, partial [Linum perenne]
RLPKEYTSILPRQPATLTVPSRDTWEMQLFRARDGFIWLGAGWENFYAFYRMDFGHLLMFQYTGDSNFSVVIFNRTAAEITYPLRNPPSHQASEDSDSVEILDEPPAEPAHVEDADYTSSIEILRGRPDNVRADPVSEDVFQSDYPFFMLELGACRLSAAKMIVRLLTSYHQLYYSMSLLPSHCLCCSLQHIPSSFTEDHSVLKSVQHVLLERNDIVWDTRAYLFGYKYVNLGWIQFAADNSVTSKDTCFFELIQTTPVVRFKVTIVRG